MPKIFSRVATFKNRKTHKSFETYVAVYDFGYGDSKRLWLANPFKLAELPKHFWELLFNYLGNKALMNSEAFRASTLPFWLAAQF